MMLGHVSSDCTAAGADGEIEISRGIQDPFVGEEYDRADNGWRVPIVHRVKGDSQKLKNCCNFFFSGVPPIALQQ